MSPPKTDDSDWDPVYIHSRREAILIICTWLVALLWTVPYCYLNGYLPAEVSREVTFIWGMPSWVFYGIACPWMIANLFTVWFCFGFFEDDDLGENDPEGSSGEPYSGEEGIAR
ncbi:MAG TPA: DUF997 family protein [Planctomycetaceae bacterium]|nr:DUF997 family protein [Planctomycetaceae bacterium]